MAAIDLTQAIQRLEFWQEGNLTSFTGDLYDLMCKADPENFRRLSEAFPLEAHAWTMWRESPDPKKFFDDNRNPQF